MEPEAATEVNHSLLRTEVYKERFKGNGNVLNTEPKFKGPTKYDFSLDTLSPASGAAKVLPAIRQDLRGAPRSTTRPDIGAYERTID